MGNVNTVSNTGSELLSAWNAVRNLFRSEVESEGSASQPSTKVAKGAPVAQQASVAEENQAFSLQFSLLGNGKIEEGLAQTSVSPAACGGDTTQVGDDDDDTAPVGGDDDDTTPVGDDDDVATDCEPIPIDLQDVAVIPFNGNSDYEIIEMDGEWVLHFTASNARDAGLAILPGSGLGWQLDDCQTQLRFDTRGEIVQRGDYARLALQVYVEGDNPSAPSVWGDPGDLLPNDPANWETQAIGIPPNLQGRLIIKVQPLAISDNADVDVYFRLFEFI
ncbi:hypothetical protein ACFL5U_01385 [Candidatus Margulisiibacteriota bacterium]